MNDQFDIELLTPISTSLTATTDSELSNTYSIYSLYAENRNDEDIPYEYKCNLYSLFNAAIDNMMIERNDIIIGEEISSKGEILSEDNFGKIMSELSSINDSIEYEKIVEFASSIDSVDPSADIHDITFKWLSEMLGINFALNENPENSDDTNLILTQRMKTQILDLTQTVLTKVFRNLMQLVRVRHSYRLYGPGSTIFGGKSSSLDSNKKLGSWSGLPESCWKEYSGNYIVGKSAYNEDIEKVEDGTIKDSTYDIAPYTVYGLSPHIHNVTIDIGNLPTSFSVSRKVWSDCVVHENRASYIEDETKLKKWTECARKSLLPGLTPWGFADVSDDDNGSIKTSYSWKYSWASNNYCKLTKTNSMKSNPFKKDKTTLPTYATYVWKWVGADDTNIEEPDKYFK